jgi:hypothetical protein
MIIICKGASKIMIRFDPQSSIHTHDPLTRCAFYRDEGYNQLIASYRQFGRNTQPIVLEGSEVYFRFTSGPGETFWGYKFVIYPLQMRSYILFYYCLIFWIRLNDNQALAGLNFELGYWLLDLLLEKGGSFVKSLYIRHLYDGILNIHRAFINFCI